MMPTLAALAQALVIVVVNVLSELLNILVAKKSNRSLLLKLHHRASSHQILDGSK
jgi:hypothetical protein